MITFVLRGWNGVIGGLFKIGQLSTKGGTEEGRIKVKLEMKQPSG